MDHEIGPWKMSFFHGPTWWSNFLKNKIYKVFGPLTRWKPNVDQEEWSCHPKVNMHKFLYMTKKGSFEKKKIEKGSNLTILLSSLVFTFSSQKKIIQNLL